MDETKELELDRIEASAWLDRGDQAASRELSRAGAAMLEGGLDVESVAATALEAALSLTAFERGFLLVAGADAEAASSAPLNVLASRSWRVNADDRSLVELTNPEFFLNRSVISRALAARRLIVVSDSLLQPTESEEANQRSILCFPFDLTDRERGVIYLDRPWGGSEIDAGELRLFKEFVERCLYLVARSFAFGELAKLRGAEVPLGDDGEGLAEGLLEETELPAFHGLVGRDEKLVKIFQVVKKVKDNDLNICIVGESGTGKELLARAIHSSGKRRDAAFVAENCGAIPETLLESELFGHVRGAFTGADDDRKGLFELANGGTLFLDEIGDMSEGMQRKLLRVLQEGVVRPIGGKDTIKVDVRVITASNRDLKILVQKGQFRTDLYYRLNVISLELPPLRERPGDIPLLLQKFTADVCREEGLSKRFSESATKALEQYTWPGNVRELRNVVRRVLITSPRRIVARKEVSEYLKSRGPVAHSGKCIERDGSQIILRVPARESFNQIIDECERVVLEHALNECAWNKSKVTKVLKIPRQSLYNKIAKYDLRRKWQES